MSNENNTDGNTPTARAENEVLLPVVQAGVDVKAERAAFETCCEAWAHGEGDAALASKGESAAIEATGEVL